MSKASDVIRLAEQSRIEERFGVELQLECLATDEVLIEWLGRQQDSPPGNGMRAMKALLEIADQCEVIISLQVAEASQKLGQIYASVGFREVEDSFGMAMERLPVVPDRVLVEDLAELLAIRTNDARRILQHSALHHGCDIARSLEDLNLSCRPGVESRLQDLGHTLLEDTSLEEPEEVAALGF